VKQNTEKIMIKLVKYTQKKKYTQEKEMSFVSVTKWICAGCQANMSDQSGFKLKCQSSSCREQQ